MMNTKDADALGIELAGLVKAGRFAQTSAALAPVLSSKTPFRLLDRIGARIGEGPLQETNAFLETIARKKAMGAWPLIGSALAAQFGKDPDGALMRCRAFIIQADVWYAADTLAERVAGEALVADFNRALAILKDWRSDPDRWVRKSAGVAIHLWTKRSRGEKRHLPKVNRLLAFLAPVFSEEDLDAVKGIGWALKTLGRYYPDTVAPWLVRQAGRARSVRPLMLRKATTYLSPAQRNKVYMAAYR
ncbi:MAG: DNA alkylation repair protein [Anaerolineales bacterium]